MGIQQNTTVHFSAGDSHGKFVMEEDRKGELWYKTEITLYFLCVSVIESECVTQLITNPIIRIRTRRISGVHVTIRMGSTMF
jgi:hypothetical protein